MLAVESYTKVSRVGKS